jgi:hypothetical protein
MKTYTLLYRPPSFATLPPQIGWTLVERPARTPHGFERRTDLPVSAHPFGVFTFDRELTPDEIERFELVEVTSREVV